MLQRAATALPEMSATRFHPVRRAGDQLNDFGLVEVTMTLAQTHYRLFAQQRAADKDRLAIDTGHTTTVMTEIGDDGFEGRQRNGVGS